MADLCIAIDRCKLLAKLIENSVRAIHAVEVKAIEDERYAKLLKLVERSFLEELREIQLDILACLTCT